MATFHLTAKCHSDHLPGDCDKDIYEHTINELGEVLYKRDLEGKRIKAIDENGIAHRKKDDKGVEIKPFCVCCKKEGHPANFKGWSNKNNIFLNNNIDISILIITQGR